MKPFHETIRNQRKKQGFLTAKEFHKKKNKELKMSYESYANIEAGKYLPPAHKLPNLVTALEIEDIKNFIFCYCCSLMPNDFFKSFFYSDAPSSSVLLKSDSYTNYKEKFEALLKLNKMQEKYELTNEQVQFLETDLVAWDMINLFISSGNEGFTLDEISTKTNLDIPKTQKIISKLISLKMLKQLPNNNYLVTQDAFFIPKKPVADRLTYLLLKREMESSYANEKNRPYCRFRFMPIDPKERENIELFIDNFIVDTRKFINEKAGKTFYLQVLFSDRNDLH